MRQPCQIGLGVLDEGQCLRFRQAPAHNPRHAAIGIQQHPRRIHPHAQLPRQQAAHIQQHRHGRIVQPAIPRHEVGLRLLVQEAGRGQRDQIHRRREALIGGPGIGVGQFRQTQRAPAGPELHQRGPARLDVGGGRLVGHVLQLLQIGQRQAHRLLGCAIRGLRRTCRATALRRRSLVRRRRRRAVRWRSTAVEGPEHHGQQDQQQQVPGREQSSHDHLLTGKGPSGALRLPCAGPFLKRGRPRGGPICTSSFRLPARLQEIDQDSSP